MMKLNVDGAIVRGRRGGVAAAVCRNSDGTYLGSSAIVYRGMTDPVIPETYACTEALSLANDLAIQSLTVASDCQGVINDIKLGTRGPHAAIIHEIMARSSSFLSCSFVHERRNHNFEAHNLAKFACNLGIGRHVWLGVPHDPNLVPMNIIANQ